MKLRGPVKLPRICALVALCLLSNSVQAQSTELQELRRRQAARIRDAKRDSMLNQLTMAEERERSRKAGDPGYFTNGAIVDKDRLWLTLGTPAVPVALSKPERYGHYVWRWDVREGGQSFSIVLAADTAMRSGDFGDIVAASKLRLCRSVFETSALSCNTPLLGAVVRRGQTMRVEIKDTSIVNALRARRPAIVVNVVFVPQGRSRMDRIPLVYRDGERVDKEH